MAHAGAAGRVQGVQQGAFARGRRQQAAAKRWRRPTRPVPKPGCPRARTACSAGRRRWCRPPPGRPGGSPPAGARAWRSYRLCSALTAIERNVGRPIGSSRGTAGATCGCVVLRSRNSRRLSGRPQVLLRTHTPLLDASHAMTAGLSAVAPPPSALAGLGVLPAAPQHLLATQPAGSAVCGKQPSASTGHMLPTPSDGQVPAPALEALLQTLGNPMAQLGGGPGLPMAAGDHPLAHAASAPVSGPASRGRPGRTASDARPASSYNARHQQARGRGGVAGAAAPFAGPRPAGPGTMAASHMGDMAAGGATQLTNRPCLEPGAPLSRYPCCRPRHGEDRASTSGEMDRGVPLVSLALLACSHAELLCGPVMHMLPTGLHPTCTPDAPSGLQTLGNTSTQLAGLRPAAVLAGAAHPAPLPARLSAPQAGGPAAAGAPHGACQHSQLPGGGGALCAAPAGVPWSSRVVLCCDACAGLVGADHHYHPCTAFRPARQQLLPLLLLLPLWFAVCTTWLYAVHAACQPPGMVSCRCCTGCCSRAVSCCLAAAANGGAAVPARLPRVACCPVCCYRWFHQAALLPHFPPRSGAWLSWSASWACLPQYSSAARLSPSLVSFEGAAPIPG